MSDTKTSTNAADWTRLLSDSDLIGHLGELLKTYREASPEKRDAALLDAMRKIKAGKPSSSPAASPSVELPVAYNSLPTTPATKPPFEPDLFTPSGGQDRRRYPRLKCYVAVELRIAGSDAPVWGNLANTSMGGAFVELATPVSPGVVAEIGLWLATGKIWVKGLVLNGVVTSSSPSYGVRIKFSALESGERENLRQFLKFIESETKGYQAEHGYLSHLKS